MTDVTLITPPVHHARASEPPRFSSIAITAFVVVFFASAVGLVLGYVALHQIERTRESGRGLAVAAVVLGWIGTVGFLLLAALVVGGSWVFRIF